ncbi:MAG: sigma-70 family RNA polymerase sigma factor, partial [Verrucomicrobiota bacterium]
MNPENNVTPIVLQQADEFEALLEAHREPLRRFLVSLTASGAAAEDLTQETCMVLWRKREQFEPGTNFKAWAFQIAFFCAKNHRRKQARAKELALPDEGLLDKLAAAAEKIDGQWDAEAEHLPHCLSKLTERNRELVTRRY